jgi:hypothetical protein
MGRELSIVSIVCILIHIILIIFIWSGNHEFYIQFSGQLGLQSFIKALYYVFVKSKI